MRTATNQSEQTLEQILEDYRNASGNASGNEPGNEPGPNTNLLRDPSRIETDFILRSFWNFYKDDSLTDQKKAMRIVAVKLHLLSLQDEFALDFVNFVVETYGSDELKRLVSRYMDVMLRDENMQKLADAHRRAAEDSTKQ